MAVYLSKMAATMVGPRRGADGVFSAPISCVLLL